MKKSTLLLSIIGILLVVGIVIYFGAGLSNKSNTQSAKEKMEEEYEVYVDVLDKTNVYQPSVKVEKEEEVKDKTVYDYKLVITNDIEKVFDYYVCQYITSALNEYFYTLENKDVDFTVNSELELLDDSMDNVAVTVRVSDGKRLKIKMYRLTDTWEWELY